MAMNHLFIKNMVCDRCRASVQQVLEKLHVPFTHIELGEVILAEAPDEPTRLQMKEHLASLGFELIEDRNSKIISKIRATTLDFVRNPGKKIKLSVHLTDVIGRDYHSLSSLFSSVEGTTIEQYYIQQKIEYVKELLAYDELSLTQIADKLQYSSVQHLSNQFKKITGLTPGHFKLVGTHKRIALDKI